MVQYTVAALASENKILAHPTSADSILSSANVEDRVSMGPTAVRHAQQILTHVETIVAVGLLAGALASAVGHYHLARSIPDPSVVSATETALTGEV
jgi:histidine ammonia-lyase